jgi:NAD-dependent deacetylase
MLAHSRSILFVTAGISADSGLPTYRGSGGLYDIDTTEDGLPIERALAGDICGIPELTRKHRP